MKHVLLFALTVCSGAAIAQPKLISQATINTTTNVIAPDDEDVANIQPQGGGGPGGGRMMFANMGDGETKSVSQVKNYMVKTVIKSDMGRITIIRNNESKLTTTLMEMMGNKTGFYATDDEQAEMRKRMDSMMKARAKDSTTKTSAPQVPIPAEISYTEETKKIAGYVCKKAYLINTRILGIKDTAIVWFTPDFKINNLISTGGSAMSFGMGNNAGNPMNGVDKIDGFVMRYETKMRRGRTMTVEVTKVDLSKEIADKDFDIPKDFDVKPMKEMGAMMGGQGNQMQIRRSD